MFSLHSRGWMKSLTFRRRLQTTVISKTYVFVLMLVLNFYLSASSMDSLPETYVPTVIIEADWGDGPGEYGMNIYSSPTSGPGGFVLDEEENIYILDSCNGRIHKYDSNGNFIRSIDLIGEGIFRFTVDNNIIYGVVFTGLDPVKKIKMIDAVTGEIINTLEILLPESNYYSMYVGNEEGNIIISKRESNYNLYIENEEGNIIISKLESYHSLDIENEEGNIIISRPKYEEYTLGGFNEQGEIVSEVLTEIITNLETILPESYHNLDIRNQEGNIIISRWEKERYILGGFSEQEEIVTAMLTEIPENPQGIFTKSDQTQGIFNYNEQDFMISNTVGEPILNARLLGKDREGNFYISVWSDNPVHSDKPPCNHQIFKFSQTGSLLACFEIPIVNKECAITCKNPQVSPGGDIYYLYPTGTWQEREDSDVFDFIPGEVQLIKWELQL